MAPKDRKNHKRLDFGAGSRSPVPLSGRDDETATPPVKPEDVGRERSDIDDDGKVIPGANKRRRQPSKP